jgi:hypothetical protein
MTWVLIALAAIAVLCGIGWLKNAIALRTVLMYMLKHRYTLPSEEEMTALCKLAIRMTLGLRSGNDDE